MLIASTNSNVAGVNGETKVTHLFRVTGVKGFDCVLIVNAVDKVIWINNMCSVLWKCQWVVVEVPGIIINNVIT